MANYLVNKFKGKYRILPDLDVGTNDFARNPDGSIDEDMVYIACQNGSKIWYYGLNESRRAILAAYIPSIGRGRNVKKAIKKEKIEIIDYNESDEEVMFRFKAEDIDAVADLMKAKTSGSNISPFSTRNLPKDKTVKIPDNEIDRYKAITSKVIKKGDMLLIKNVNASFLTDVLEKTLKKKNKKYSYKDDMKKLKMSRQVKEFIWHKEMFDEYLDFLDKEINAYYNNK